ncbi:MAG: hypothetical protein GX495_12805 [Chloroflexi bacterium]|jgi:hypothetical protein|nr:hypothetical protein [Chloroflexota bacterium]
MIFADRREAGQILAQELEKYRDRFSTRAPSTGRSFFDRRCGCLAARIRL